MDKHIGVLFDVFKHPNGACFAIGEAADKSTLVIERVSPMGEVTIKQTTKVAAVSAMGQKLRRGFSRYVVPMYFDSVQKEFSHVHTDLNWGGRLWVLASNPPVLEEGIEAVAKALQTVDPTQISQEEVVAWSVRQRQNNAYMVAFNDLPLWSLVVAQTAMQHGWPVRANPQMKGAPAHLPSTNPAEWGEWLQQTFDAKPVQSAITALGYTLDHFFKSDQQALIDEGNWSSLL